MTNPTYSFFKDTLTYMLDKFSTVKKGLYCMYNTERIINNYTLIYKQYNIEDKFDIRVPADDIWSYLLRGVPIKDCNMAKYILDCDMYPGVLNTLALNVCINLQVTNDVILDKNSLDSQPSLTGLYVYDTIHQVLLSKCIDNKYITKEVELRLDETRVVKNEVEHQLDIIKILEDSKFSETLVKDMYSKSIENIVSYNNIYW